MNDYAIQHSPYIVTEVEILALVHSLQLLVLLWGEGMKRALLLFLSNLKTLPKY